jgi:hypothetical protein
MLQLKLKAPGPPCISSKSIMQLSKMISLDSAIFIEEKKRWQMEIGEKAKKWWQKKRFFSAYGPMHELLFCFINSAPGSPNFTTSLRMPQCQWHVGYLTSICKGDQLAEIHCM